MPSLIECVLLDLEGDRFSNVIVNSEELLAERDMDSVAISSVEGSWEIVDVGENRADPHVEGLVTRDFNHNTPPVHEKNGFMIVRGREEGHYVYFVYEPTV